MSSIKDYSKGLLSGSFSDASFGGLDSNAKFTAEFSAVHDKGAAMVMDVGMLDVDLGPAMARIQEPAGAVKAEAPKVVNHFGRPGSFQ